MNKDSVPIYYEECNKITMSYYPFFLDKLTQVQNLSKKFCLKDLDQKNIIIKKIICSKCKIIDFYELGNIVWTNNIEHKIKSHQYYPSEYFIKVIINMYIINDTIVNPPIQLNPDQINTFDYVPLHYNKLLIIDAFMYQGSYPRYLVPKKKISTKNLFIRNILEQYLLIIKQLIILLFLQKLIGWTLKIIIFIYLKILIFYQI